jgi:arylformamidase
VGEVCVVSVGEKPRDIAAEELLPRIPAGAVRVLLRTGQSIASGAFPDDWPALHPSAAHALVTNGVRLLGVDAPSVDRRHSTTLAVHHEIFDGGAAVLENLDLRNVPDGAYELIALPLRWKGLDAAPVRAVLRIPRREAAGR